MTENIIQFAPRPAVPEISLANVELRLFRQGEDVRIQMSLFDEDCGVIDVLVFKLASRPRHFILDLLCEAWEHWRAGGAGLAS